MKLDELTGQAVSASLQRMQQRSAFFSTLALFAKFESSKQIPTAATDGKTIFVNPDFFAALTPDEQDGLLAHEVLHDALLHVPRRGGRDPQLWNVAADIVINGMLIKDGYILPKGGLRDQQLEKYSTEEVYERLIQKQEQQKKHGDQQSSSGEQESGEGERDLLDQAPSDAEGQQSQAERSGGQAAKEKEMERHWQQALEQARQRADNMQIGTQPGGFTRELAQTAPGRLDWRSVLWRFLVKTPSDFQDYDRRFVGRGLYLETTSGDNLTVLVCVDTSGSINQQAVQVFLGELQSILRSYPHLRCDLYFADSKVYGPHRLSAQGPLPTPIGGGGTDFRPFFEQIPNYRPPWDPSVVIYMTDGYGSFPKQKPRCPVLWVVTPTGIDESRFPFGQVVRLFPNG